MNRAMTVILSIAWGLLAAGCGSELDSLGPEHDAGYAQDYGLVEAEAISDPISTRARCSNYGCDDKDPIDMRCDRRALTVASAPIYRNGTQTQIGLVELRWSNTCGTNWSRVRRYAACAEYMLARVERSSPHKVVDEPLSGYCQIYSNMVYARGIPARACGLVDESWTSGYACTAWR